MNRIESEKQKNIDFANTHGISEVEMENIFQSIYNKMPTDLDEDKKIIRSLRKTRASLKRLVQSGNRFDGFVFMRLPNQEYNLYAWNKVQKFIDENSLEKAIAQGMAKDENTYLHTEGYNKGKPINKKDIYGKAVGIFQVGEKVTPYEISIGSYAMDKVLPICKDTTISLKEGKKDSQISPQTKIQYFNGATETERLQEFKEEKAEEYLDYIKDCFGDIIFESFSDALDYLELKNFDKNAFVGVRAICLETSVPDDPERDIPISFEFLSDDADITIYVHPIEFAGLNIEDGLEGYLFFNAIKRNDNTNKYHCGGFLPIE